MEEDFEKLIEEGAKMYVEKLQDTGRLSELQCESEQV